MSMSNRNNEKNKFYFALITSGAYIAFGITQFIIGLGFIANVSDMLFIPPDIIGGLILILIGIIFVFGVKRLHSDNNEGVAFIFAGIFLALIYLIIYLLIFAADAAEAYLLLSEDFATWSPLDDVRPGIYLGILPLVGFLIWRNKFKLS